MSSRFSAQMERSPFAAYTPAMTSSESPGRKKTSAPGLEEDDEREGRDSRPSG